MSSPARKKSRHFDALDPGSLPDTLKTDYSEGLKKEIIAMKDEKYPKVQCYPYLQRMETTLSAETPSNTRST
jgi:hypothetical protein